MEQLGFVRRRQGVVELLDGVDDPAFRRHVFPIAQINTGSAVIPDRPAVIAGGERGGLLRDVESSLAQIRTKYARAFKDKNGAVISDREAPRPRAADPDQHAAELDGEAASLARWLVANLAGLQWAPAYRIGQAIADGQWSRAELRRVLRFTLERRARGELESVAGYFVSACKNEIEREGYRWRQSG